MGRVTAQEVKEIIETSLSDNVIDTYINASNLTVTEILGTNTDLSSDQKKEIERFYTAHLIACTRTRQAQEEKLDEATIKYLGKTGDGLDSTHYGQIVKQLDTTGTFAHRTGKQEAEIYAITSFV